MSCKNCGHEKYRHTAFSGCLGAEIFTTGGAREEGNCHCGYFVKEEEK
jgi:ferredoxin-thioredoxin reductase catalytic subunit